MPILYCDTRETRHYLLRPHSATRQSWWADDGFGQLVLIDTKRGWHQPDRWDYDPPVKPIDEITKLRAKISELEEDKARIDWMEARRDAGDPPVFRRWGKQWVTLFTCASQHTNQHPTIRSAIDRAMEIAP